MTKTYQKAAALLLALVLIFAFPISASAAEMTEAKVPVTLTVVNTVAPISCTVPACLPVSLVDGYVVTANNAAITNTAKTGSIKVTKVDVQAGTFEIGNYDDFSASKNSIALAINGCSTKSVVACHPLPREGICQRSRNQRQCGNCDFHDCRCNR